MNDFWFPTAFNDLEQVEISAIDRVVASRRFTMGPETEAFEREFADYHDMRFGIMVNSGSAANLIAAFCLYNLKDRRPIRRGNNVVVPALAWGTTYAPWVQLGMNLILSDCDGTWNAAEHAQEWDADEIAVVVGCSILGNAGYLSEWKNWADIHGAYFVEDNCESLGARCDQRLTGTFGVLNTFSFFYSHQLNGLEGGMILTNDDELARVCRLLRDHGLNRKRMPNVPFDKEYDFELFGFNARPLEFSAAVGREQLKRLPHMSEARLRNWKYFWEGALAEDLPITCPHIHGEPNPFGIAFLTESSDVRTKLAWRLRDKEIDCRPPTGGSFRLHQYGRPWDDQLTPNADIVHRQGLFIGCAPYDIRSKIDRTIKIIKDTL